MKKNLRGKNGISIRLVTQKLKKEMIKTPPQIGNKRRIKNSFESGKLTTSDWKYISIGLKTLDRIVNEGIFVQENQLLSGKSDVSRIKKEILGFKELIQDCINRLANSSRDEYEFQKTIDLLLDYSQITQAARDGIIVKQEKRVEKIDGKEKETIYDTSMTPREVYEILREYERQADRLQFDKLNNYLELGLGLAGTVGTIIRNNQTKNKTNRVSVPIITIGTVVVGGLKLLQGMMKNDNREKLWQMRDEEYKLRSDLLNNEQISAKAEESAIKSIRNVVNEEIKLQNKLGNSIFMYDLGLDLAEALISGAYINSRIQTKENGKIDGKSLAYALISLRSAKGIAGNFISTVQGMVSSRQDEEEFQETCKKVQEILNQMEEKVYPLEGAKHSFDSISINDFIGNFYSKKDYDSGEISYATTIRVPEFSMKRGDVVLLSGESGAGKSTFLRFLKRGDINNRKAIKLDNGEKVDNLGEEYISFRPSINLGDETNVLYQITGKKNISDLSKEEQKNLEKILKELKFDAPNLLQQLSTKKFMEFSTGQQRRLALSKVFYRIDDGTSVIIVDEPVGNVEDSLIREQLEMIKKYAKRKNVMLLLTTHRLDLAKDLATKRYNINKDGVMEQIPVKSKELEI